MSTEVSTERVAMLWPAELKARVQQLVGKRGLTAFTLEAVEQLLTTRAAEPAPEPAPPVDVHEAVELDVPAPVVSEAPVAPVASVTGENDTPPSASISERIMFGPHHDRVDELRAAAAAAGLPLTTAAEIDTAAELLDADAPTSTSSATDDPTVVTDGTATSTSDPVAAPPPTDAATATSDVCPKCFSPMLAGECWACSF